MSLPNCFDFVRVNITGLLLQTSLIYELCAKTTVYFKSPHCWLCRLPISHDFLQQWLASLTRRWHGVKLTLNPCKGLRKYYEHANKNKLRFCDHNNYPAKKQTTFAREGYYITIHNVLTILISSVAESFAVPQLWVLALIFTDCRHVYSCLNNCRSLKTFHTYTSCAVLCQHCKSQGQSLRNKYCKSYDSLIYSYLEMWRIVFKT